MKYRTVATGTDGSDTSLVAVRTAASVARAYDAELIIISAYYSASGSVLGSPSTDTTSIPVVNAQDAEGYLEEAKRVAQDEGATTIRTIALEGSPVSVLTESIAQTGADLLVLGNRGIHSFAGRIFGNIPSGVVRHSAIDVMVVNTEKGISAS